MKKSKIKYLNLITIPSFVLVASSCQSSFYKQQKALKAEYLRELNSNLKQYKENIAVIDEFIETEENYKKYYIETYTLVKKATDEWNNVLFKTFSKDDKTKSFYEFLDSDKYDLKLGYFDSDNQFKELEKDDYFNNEVIDLIGELKKDSTGKINTRLKIKYTELINDEMYLIVDDWVKYLKTGSNFREFLNVFSHYENWPFFEGSIYQEQLKRVFKYDLEKYHSVMEDEYKTKYYDKSRIKIDYEQLISPDPEVNQGHTHALVNLWNEWNSAVAPIYKEDSKTEIDWEKNLLKQVADFFENIYKTEEKVKKDLWLRFENKEDKKQIHFDVKKTFDNFLLSIVYDTKTFKIRLEPSEYQKEEFGDFFKINIENLKKTAKKIVDTTRNYE